MGVGKRVTHPRKKIAPQLPKERGHPGRPYSNSHRQTIEGILWIGRTGTPWRDLPPQFGYWNTVYQRFRRWTRAGIFRALRAAPLARCSTSASSRWTEPL